MVPVKFLTINEVTVELKTGIIKDKVDSPSALSLESFYGLPQLGEVIIEYILFGLCELFATSGL